MELGKKTPSIEKKNLPSFLYLPSTLLGTRGTQVNKCPSQTDGRKRHESSKLQCNEIGIGVKVCARYCINLPGTFLVSIYGLSIIIHRILSPSKVSLFLQ